MYLSHSAFPFPDGPPEVADLVLAFGAPEHMRSRETFDAVRARYPGARIAGASSGGVIRGAEVSDDGLVVTSIRFDASSVDVVHAPVEAGGSAADVGHRLGSAIPLQDAHERPLVHVVVLADGIHLNGSALAQGLEAALPDGVGVTGALAGDDDRFQQTTVWADVPRLDPAVVAVAFYSHSLRVGVGTGGGWDTFGVERQVTQADGNVLAELDHQPALDLYDRYLGPYAQDLPASGLRFPLAVRTPDGDYELVRTLLGIDRDSGSITFAGDIPEGATARLMRANPDHLVDGACCAAQQAAEALGAPPEFALLVSCVGRKWTLGERIEEEVEGAIDALGGAPAIGLYSYGELAPAAGGGRCELHNQTMTITTFAESGLDSHSSGL